MDSLQYSEFLKNKYKILQGIYKNTLEQTAAIDKKDYSSLARLLNERESLITSLKLMTEHSDEDKCKCTNEENIEFQKQIDILYNEIREVFWSNAEKAESQKDEIAAEIRHLRLGKSAIVNGYFKKMPQRYGYFIDKKLG